MGILNKWIWYICTNNNKYMIIINIVNKTQWVFSLSTNVTKFLYLRTFHVSSVKQKWCKKLPYYAQFRSQLVQGLKRDEKWKISPYETDDLYD